jgi:coenzyme PQQ biosynthesis protein PqqD
VRDVARLALASKARLRWDRRDGAHYLLYPERGLRLNETATAIVQLCDGTRTEEEIAHELAARFADRDPDAIRSEVGAFLGELRRRALLAEVER